ncbi:hypothetical protein BDZ89DRAFT_382853 [Hymenopellis radicata]|nr:hypothetical protein BDZ89DRAFT_382853 [Hymenopellis radicata]
MDTPTLTTADRPSTTLPSRPATAVTFDSPEHPSSLLPISRRASTIGYNVYGEGGYSVSASARTSYTRVDTMTDDQVDAYPTQVAEVERADEPAGEIPRTPQISLTFLLVSGRRRTMNFDPTYTVGRVKELVWNTWPGGSFLFFAHRPHVPIFFFSSDWQDERPPAPSFLRILHLGKVLQDEDILKGAFFPIDAPPTIVHMSIRPGALADDLSKKGEEEVVCCCVIC